MNVGERFTEEELNRMVTQADRCRRDVITLSPLADVCGHVKALVSEVETWKQEYEKLVADIAALTDTGSDLHKRTFDPDGVGEFPNGWRVVEKIRERVLR